MKRMGKKNMRRTGVVLALTVLLLSALPVYAADDTAPVDETPVFSSGMIIEHLDLESRNDPSLWVGNGMCGEEIEWEFHDRVLYISGQGEMYEKASFSFLTGKVIEVVFSGEITSISDLAFMDCTQLQAVTFPSALKSIGFDAFYRTNLSTVTLPDGLQTIGAAAFAYSTLRQISIPDSVQEIGEFAFGCDTLPGQTPSVLDVTVIAGEGSAAQKYALEQNLTCVLRGDVNQSGAVDIADYEFEGYFVLDSFTDKLHAGLDPDFKNLRWKLIVKTEDGTYSDSLIPASFTVKSGAYSDCFTIDTSELDMTTPGEYQIYIHTIGGTVREFNTYKDTPLLPAGYHNVLLTEHDTAVPVTVLPALPHIVNFGNSLSSIIELGQGGYRDLVLWNYNDPGSIEFTYSMEPEGIVTVSEVHLEGDSPRNRHLQFDTLALGETILTATSSDGITAQLRIQVVEKMPLDTTTIQSETETTITTSTTASLASDTTTIQSETETTAMTSTASSETTYLPDTDTTAATTIFTDTTAGSDLPQTGNNAPARLLAVLSALITAGAGAALLALRRKEETK